MDLGQLLFGFQGRVNRANFWLGVGIWIAGYILLSLLAGAAFWILGSWIAAVVIGLLILIPLIVVSVAVGIKRLHDRDKSGWWLLLFYLLPGVLQVAGGALGSIGLILLVVALAISVWALVELGCLRGTVGSNQYGPDPLAGMAGQPA
jgi:uncharacterized membrane protein YhaH (DUF805 family)